MTAINRAWKLLGDEASRATYDRERAARAAATDALRRPDPGEARPDPTASHSPRPAAASPHGPRPPERVSRDWTSGRSSTGYAYDPASMRTADGAGAAGRPPGNPSGSVLNFGRYDGWSLGEIARSDLEYIEWLDRTPIGRPYREEIDTILRRAGRRKSDDTEAVERRGLFRRR
jgi:curved DNA-binding protein CbpA